MSHYKAIDYSSHSTYCNIKDEGGDFIKYMAKKFPGLVNRAMGSAAWQTWAVFKKYPEQGGTKTERWKQHSRLRKDKKFAAYHNDNYTGKFYGKMWPAIGYVKVPTKMQIRFGWRSKTSMRMGTLQEQGDISETITKKQQRHLAAFGYKFKKGHKFNLPKRKIFIPIYEEERFLFLDRLEKKLHAYRKNNWKKT